MDIFQKIGLIVVAILIAVYVKLAFFGSADIVEESPVSQTEQVEEEPQEQKITVKDEKKDFVNVFFIAHNAKGEEVYRAVKREYTPEIEPSRLKFAIKELINGPTAKEKKLGVYSEIPVGTRLISLTETPSKVVVNLSAAFEDGGGTDGLYKRLFQLIKTTKRNSNLPLYLQLNGKLIDVIGGEGIMINQPLNEDFANE